MKRLLLLLSLLVGIGAIAHAQTRPAIIWVNADPSGSCQNGAPLQNNPLLGHLSGCKAGTWQVIASGNSGGASPAGVDGSVQLKSGSSLGFAAGYRVQAPFVGVAAGNATLFGTVTVPTLTSAAAAGTGTLSIGTHKWCVTAAGSSTGPSAGTGVNYGEGLCSSVVTAVVANQATQGKQTLTFAGTGAYYDSIFIYRSDDGGTTYSYDTSVGANVTTYDDAGDSLDATKHPPTLDGSFIEAAGKPFNNQVPYWLVELPGTGNGDVFWGLNSCYQYNVNPDQLYIAIHACDWNGPSGLAGPILTMQEGVFSVTGAPVTFGDLATTGAATGKTAVCADTNGKLYRSSASGSCAN